MSDMTETVRKLLDKAQSSEFAAEAEAFFAKAAALMETHNISEAALRAAGTVQSDEVTSRDFRFDAPYSYGKMMIGWRIGLKYGLKGVRTGGGYRGATHQTLTFFGTKSNLDDYEMILAAVQLHATGELLKAEKPAYEHGRSFRAAFLEGYASRISSVLGAARREAKAEARANLSEEESKGVGLVLVEEKERVEAAFKERFAKVRSSSGHSARSSSGRSAGSSAASRFSGHRTGVSGSRGALGA